MTQVVVYLDPDTAKRMDEAVGEEQTSRSAWVKKAIEDRLLNRLPESFFSTIGAWEDERTTEQILADIRGQTPQGEREQLA
jgi:predicted transcriptional regulator